MSLTVSDIIEGAELRAYPYVAEEGTPAGVLVRQLSGLDSEVVGMVVLENPGFLNTASSEITIVTATNSSGYTLQAARSYSNFQWIDDDDNVFPIRIVSEQEYDHPPRHPAGIINGVTFLPCDPLELRWEQSDARTVYAGDGDVVTYSYVPEHTKLTALADTCEGPDFARGYYEASLALNIMLSFPTGAPQAKLAEMKGLAEKARRDLLLAIAKQVPMQTSLRSTGEVY